MQRITGKKLAIAVTGLIVVIAFFYILSVLNNSGNSTVGVSQTGTVVEEVVVKPTADTFVRERYSTKNYEKSKEIISDGDPKATALLKFDISDVDFGKVNKAQLSIKPRISRKIEKKVRLVTGSWDASKVTWKTMPKLGATIGEIKGEVEKNTTKEYDLNLETLKSSGDILSIAIEDTSKGYSLSFNSIESGSPGIELVFFMSDGSVTQPEPQPEPQPVDPIDPVDPVDPIDPLEPLPQPSATKGIWISKEEIMALPMSGNGWNKVFAAAKSNWGSADLGSLNTNHDVNTFAGALVSVRLGEGKDGEFRRKTIAGIESAMKSGLSRALELSRGLPSYIIAADIIGYETNEFKEWIREMLEVKVAYHSGGSNKLCNSQGVHENCSNLGGVVCTAVRSSNNWGGMARAAVIAAARYLGDDALMQKMVNAHKAFIGEPATNSMYCTDTTWHSDPSNKAGVNRLNSSIGGNNVSGALPEDWRRGADYRWPAKLDGYMWEGMQGYVASAVMLDRAGLLSKSAGDNAVVRSMDILFDIGYSPTGDDSWMPWLVNKVWGSKVIQQVSGRSSFPTTSSDHGKGFGWTEWTHQ